MPAFLRADTASSLTAQSPHAPALSPRSMASWGPPRPGHHSIGEVGSPLRPGGIEVDCRLQLRVREVEPQFNVVSVFGPSSVRISSGAIPRPQSADRFAHPPHRRERLAQRPAASSTPSDRRQLRRETSGPVVGAGTSGRVAGRPEATQYPTAASRTRVINPETTSLRGGSVTSCAVFSTTGGLADARWGKARSRGGRSK